MRVPVREEEVLRLYFTSIDCELFYTRIIWVPDYPAILSRTTWLIFFRWSPRNWSQSRTRDQRNIDPWFCFGAIAKTMARPWSLVFFVSRYQRATEIDAYRTTFSLHCKKLENGVGDIDRGGLDNPAFGRVSLFSAAERSDNILSSNLPWRSHENYPRIIKRN